MLVVKGNIWDTTFDTHWRVVPTNLGWRHDGGNVMGAGVAKQAAFAYPELPTWYGEQCRMMRDFPYLASYVPGRLIMFPVKPLDKTQPHLSWKRKADVKLIEEMLSLLADDKGLVVLPLVGCGNGQLPPSVVFPKMRKTLVGDNFTLVLEKAMYSAYKEVYE